jgi:hypothetical protein
MQDASNTNYLAEKLKSAILTLRIIVMALATSVVAFAIAAIAIRMQQAAAPANDVGWTLAVLGIAAAPVAFVLSRFVPGLFVAKSRRQIARGQFGPAAAANPNQIGGVQSGLAQLGDDGKLFMVYQTKTILSAALLEGAAFLNIVAFLLGGNPVALGLGALLALAIAAMFPRTGLPPSGV